MESDFSKTLLGQRLALGEEALWLNPGLWPAQKALEGLAYTPQMVTDALQRLNRFAPLLAKAFPETGEAGGLIESPLCEIAAMKEALSQIGPALPGGRLFLKMDSHLPVAGSVKARGGIYEILKYTEDLALKAGLLQPGENYAVLLEPGAKAFFSHYTVQVGSTGNLGLSIGTISAALGYRVIVHMSAEARQWKKALLRSKGVTVLEYEGDYGLAVKNGRELAAQDPSSYFVDDENSVNLLLGYATAAQRLAQQLQAQNRPVDAEHPLFVYIPCGVGGAPGGICLGLKQIYGDNVQVFTAEPTEACCMLLGLASGMHEKICVQDMGLAGRTHADGLAVGRVSGLVSRVVEHLLTGSFTLRDYRLYDYMRLLEKTEGFFVEPSACAGFAYLWQLALPEARSWLQQAGYTEKRMEDATHLVWATGGSLVPPAVREEYRQMYGSAKFK